MILNALGVVRNTLGTGSRIREYIADAHGTSMPAMYVTIGRLVAKGCIDRVAPEEGDRRRRFYSITPLGEEALRAKIEFLVPVFRDVLGSG